MAKTSLSFVAGGFVCANRRVVKQRAEKISASNLWPLIAFVHTQLPATQLQRFCPWYSGTLSFEEIGTVLIFEKILFQIIEMLNFVWRSRGILAKVIKKFSTGVSSTLIFCCPYFVSPFQVCKNFLFDSQFVNFFHKKFKQVGSESWES